MCQVEVVVIVMATGLIVHFVTRKVIQQRSTVGQGRSGNGGELGAVSTGNKPLYESVGLGTFTGEDVELQPSPACDTAPMYS